MRSPRSLVLQFLNSDKQFIQIYIWVKCLLGSSSHHFGNVFCVKYFFLLHFFFCFFIILYHIKALSRAFTIFNFFFLSLSHSRYCSVFKLHFRQNSSVAFIGVCPKHHYAVSNMMEWKKRQKALPFLQGTFRCWHREGIAGSLYIERHLLLGASLQDANKLWCQCSWIWKSLTALLPVSGTEITSDVGLKIPVSRTWGQGLSQGFICDYDLGDQMYRTRD